MNGRNLAYIAAAALTGCGAEQLTETPTPAPVQETAPAYQHITSLATAMDKADEISRRLDNILYDRKDGTEVAGYMTVNEQAEYKTLCLDYQRLLEDVKTNELYNTGNPQTAEDLKKMLGEIDGAGKYVDGELTNKFEAINTELFSSDYFKLVLAMTMESSDYTITESTTTPEGVARETTRPGVYEVGVAKPFELEGDVINAAGDGLLNRLFGNDLASMNLWMSKAQNAFVPANAQNTGLGADAVYFMVDGTYFSALHEILATQHGGRLELTAEDGRTMYPELDQLWGGVRQVAIGLIRSEPTEGYQLSDDTLNALRGTPAPVGPGTPP